MEELIANGESWSMHQGVLNAAAGKVPVTVKVHHREHLKPSTRQRIEAEIATSTAICNSPRILQLVRPSARPDGAAGYIPRRSMSAPCILLHGSSMVLLYGAHGSSMHAPPWQLHGAPPWCSPMTALRILLHSSMNVPLWQIHECSFMADP